VKLSEIINLKSAPRELTSEEISRWQQALAGGALVANISSTLELRQVGRTYALVKQGLVLGWLELGEEVTLHGAAYDTVKFIFLVPELRKTRVGGAFLVALRNHLQLPLILGSDEYGGVLFRDGVKLVQALNASSRNFVSIFDPVTGQKSELAGDIPARPSRLTLVFEQTIFPLTHLWFYLFENSELLSLSPEGDL
jgi:hypothetical protein